jgi:hypothetical protein
MKTVLEFDVFEISPEQLPKELKGKFNALTNKNKKETVEQFLTRGGKITRFPTETPFKIPESIKPTPASGPAVLMTLEEADLFYGEHKQRKAKKKAKPTIDVDALPPEIRKKYVDDVISVFKRAEEEASNEE